MPVLRRPKFSSGHLLGGLGRKIFFRRRRHERLNRFAFSGGSISRDIAEKYGYSGDLLEFFSGNSGPVIHKWHHYIPIYDRYFGPFRGRPVRLLEIGVSNGGSLSMWRRFFGPEAVIFGIDIDEACRKLDGIDGQVRIGSQADESFLRGVVAEMGGVDIVLDDGSHRMDHVRASLEVLFPLLADDGVYMIEDLHTSYWRSFGGGLRSRGNFFRYVRDLIDDMHHWYHLGGMKHPKISERLPAIHIHDSVVVLEKSPVFAPTHSRVP